MFGVVGIVGFGPSERPGDYDIAMRPGELLLIADDLTGACDAAVHFAVRGVKTVVPLLGLPFPQEGCVTAFSTDSRDLTESETATRIHGLSSQTPRFVFKKIDSVLRGKPGFEIAATMAAFELARSVVTPAFPALGRRVINGRLHVDGQTDTIDVAARLREGGLVADVADAASDAELDGIVAAALDLSTPLLWAGSGGLAAALARILCGAVLPAERPEPTSVLFGIGTDHPATTAQVAELARRRPNAQVHQIQRGLPPNLPMGTNLALFCSGGDTASAVLAELAAEAIDLRGEILPGVPWGYLRGGHMDGQPVATKSGGFGQTDTLVQVWDWFQRLA